jgi:hypothetical protein
MIRYDFRRSQEQSSRAARLAQLKYMNPVPMCINGFPDALQHSRRQFLVKVGVNTLSCTRTPKSSSAEASLFLRPSSAIS